MADNYNAFRLVLFQIWLCLLLPSDSQTQNALLSPQNVQTFPHLSRHGCSFPGSHLNSKVVLQQPVPRDGGIHNPPTLFPLPVGTTALYSCEEPYITLGEAIRVCRPDFTWSGSTPFCGLNVAMHKPLILPADRFAWLTNDGVISTRARDCYAHSFSAGITFTWKIDLTENFLIHSLRILALADFAWTANVTLQYVSRNNVPVDVHCGRLDYAGTEQTAAVSVPCRKIVPIRFLRIDFTLLSNGRLRLCEVNVLSVDALTSELCPNEASAKAVVQHSCLSFHSHAQATWGGALQTCRKMGGTLMNDIGPQEQTYLQAKLSYLHRFQPSEAFYWIGLFRSVNMSTMEDHWLWTNGNEPVASFWALNQPDKVTSRQFCTGLSGRTGWLWNDFNCESGQGFWICRTNFTSCPIPEQPENGLVTMLDRRLGGLVTYHCEEGYDLSGAASRNCLPNGTWSGVLPRCLSTITSVQSTPEMLTGFPMATFVPVMNFTSASAAPVPAKTISHISFPTTIVVQKASSQTPSSTNSIKTIQPHVEAVTTPQTTVFSQSWRMSITTSNTTQPTISATTTQPIAPATTMRTPRASPNSSQFFIETSPTTISSKAGWILPEASLNIPSNARVTAVTPETTTVNSPVAGQVTETPEAEYFAPSVTAKPTVPRPPPTVPRTRKSFPTNSTTTPRSQPLLTFPIGLQNRCNNVPVLFNGRYTVDMMGPMMVARYTCNPNFNLVGIPFLTCSPDGSWRGIMPLCIPGYGPTLIPLLSTRSKTEATRFSPVPTPVTNFNSLVTSLTPQQARLTPLVRAGPSRTITLSSNPQAANVTGATPHTTGHPESGMTRIVSYGQVDLSSSYTSRPPLGTRPLSGSASVDPSRPVVTQPPPGCPPLPVVEYGEMLYQRNTIFFRCLPGYVLVGSNSTQCLPEGVWDSLPDCFPVDCGQPEKLPNGMVILVNGSTTYGSTAAYSCSGQLVTLGIFYRICGTQGRWDGPIAECVAEIPALVPAESRQEARDGISGMMTIVVGVVGTIGGVVIVIAIAVAIKCLKSRESIPVAVSPTPYSLPSEHSPRALMTERASADIFSRARYVPSAASSQSGYEFDGSISDASTRIGRLEPRHSM